MIAKRSGYLRIASIANSFESGSHSTGWIRARSTPATSLGRDRLLGQVGLLAMMGGRSAFLPEVDLAIDNDHWRFLFRLCVRVLQVRLAPVG
jgi:hypothetical protein